MIILSKLRVKGCVSSLRDGGGRGGRAGREWGGGEVKGEKSGENKIRGGSVCACGVKSHGGVDVARIARLRGKTGVA